LRCKKLFKDKTTSLWDYDLMILDPPAYIKDRHKIKEWISWYKNINALALNLLQKNSIFVTCSCSHHIDKYEFEQIIMESASKTNKSLQVLESYGHSIDHTRLLSFREWEYLKTLFCRII
jgi:23S rRNA (cytosine1962-C5)-methyltransferase